MRHSAGSALPPCVLRLLPRRHLRRMCWRQPACNPSQHMCASLHWRVQTAQALCIQTSWCLARSDPKHVVLPAQQHGSHS